MGELVRRGATRRCSAIIGLRYLWLYLRLSPDGGLGSTRRVAYVGHMAVLAYLPILLLLCR